MRIPMQLARYAVLAFISATPALLLADEPEAKPEASEPAQESQHVAILEIEGGAYRATIDTSDAADLTRWAQEELALVVERWYPKIVEMLPSEGFEAPKEFTIIISSKFRGVAATGGTRVMCNSAWFRDNLQGEAKGAIVHELVHVVQQYGRRNRRDPDAVRPPGWLVEGIPDYIRWFLYEPESRGAEINGQRVERVKYDDSYRVSGNFINWVTGKYDKQIATKLNAKLRSGEYKEALWKEYTGHTLAELGKEWKKQLSDAEPAA